MPELRLRALNDLGGTGRIRPAKLRRNAYCTSECDGLSDDDAHILMACAVSDAAGAPPTLSHETARIIWGLPAIGRPPARVEYIVPPGTRGRTPHVRRRRTGLASAFVGIGALRVTPYERTIVDHARHARLESGVAACDSALHLGLTTREALLAELERVPRGARGRSMANLAIHLADARAESPLESLSRTRMFQASLPMPELQQWFDDTDGQVGRTDFYWPQLGLVGESDGDLKYGVAEGDPGQRAVDALLAEKRREQRLRRHPEIDDVARWDWGEALPPGKLHTVLAAYGLRAVLDGGWPVPDGPLPKRAFFPTDRLT
ncbi:hypothetical protein [Flexivirga oryzae]|uniref:Uncharacterized protein n=1 Tax=Flexivirga oryzae TaxID=1794944 RepID=A0A839N5B3_9MICO|nr:hypothetical protein [Flexivirga oryzae]MBB2891223.1 hypothetical protein [Flexivirga oryzae]